MADFKHKLGAKARDKITGFTGVITARVEYFYGCNTYGLVPAVDKDGKRGDSSFFDEGRVEILNEELCGAYAGSPFVHELGVEAIDTVTGFKGVITARAEYMYSTNLYGLNPKVDKDGKLQDFEYFEEGRVKKVQEAFTAEDVSAPKPGCERSKKDSPPLE